MKTLIDFFKNHNLEYIDKTFVVCTSTGIDSSVLLDMFIKLRSEVNINVIITHCNHHKRKQSEIEEEYIKEYAKENNIDIYIKELYFDECDDNFQMTARNMRYSFFDEVMKETKADYLVLAHHAKDNLETILMRMIRGSSLKGYSGINSCIVSCDKQYKIIRPLLSYSRKDIENYQQENNIKYFEDASNNEKTYTRNRIRHSIIPSLESESTDLYNKINDFANTILEASNIVNEKRDIFISNFVTITDEMIEFNKNDFLNNSYFMRQEILFELLKPFQLSKQNINELLKIIDSDLKNYSTYFKSLFTFCIEYNLIKIIKKEVCIDLVKPIEIKELKEYIINDKNIINVIKLDNISVTNLYEMCYNICDLPIVIRTRQNGDKIKLKVGYKKINDLFIDLKVPKAKRDEILLACLGSEVLMVFGYRRSELLKQIEIDKNNCCLIKHIRKY